MDKRTNTNICKTGSRIAVVLNVFLLTLATGAVFNALFFVKDTTLHSVLYFLVFSTRTETFHGTGYSEDDFNKVANGMKPDEVEKLLWTPLEIVAISKNGKICSKQLRVYPHNHYGGLKKINYDNADKTCVPAYEVWKYTLPDPREKSYDVREIKFKSGRVVGKVMRFQES